MPPAVKLDREGERIFARLRKAGYKVGPAKRIATTHTIANALSLGVEWVYDQDASDEGDGPRWLVIARGPDDEALGSLGGIYLGDVGPDAHHSDPYQYDAEAQALDEAIDVVEDAPRRNPRR